MEKEKLGGGAVLRMRLARRFRAGLIKSRSKAEMVFETLLKEMGIRFTRQAIFLTPSRFLITDFLIQAPRRLVIEIDGSNHGRKKRKARDSAEEAFLTRANERLIRFKDEDVLTDPGAVRERLFRELSLAGSET